MKKNKKCKNKVEGINLNKKRNRKYKNKKE